MLDELPVRHRTEHAVAVIGAQHVHRVCLQILGQHQLLLHALAEVKLVQHFGVRLLYASGYVV